jgi:hypothetical protein
MSSTQRPLGHMRYNITAHNSRSVTFSLGIDIYMYSVLLRYMVSDYTFGIFKLFLIYIKHLYILYVNSQHNSFTS